MKHKQSLGRFNILILTTALLAGVVSSVTAELVIVKPWETNSIDAMWWSYDFNDGSLPPTMIVDSGNVALNMRPKFTFTGTGDNVSIVNGQLGIHNATQESSLSIFIDVSNRRNELNIKQFWFEFDFSGDQPVLVTGTEDQGSKLLGDIVYADGTTDSRIEAYQLIDPQPDSEWLTITMSCGAGQTVSIDNLKVGSFCSIPEPGTISLMGLSTMSFLFVRRIRLRKQGGVQVSNTIRDEFLDDEDATLDEAIAMLSWKKGKSRLHF